MDHMNKAALMERMVTKVNQYHQLNQSKQTIEVVKFR
jgi:hypothetical protein